MVEPNLDITIPTNLFDRIAGYLVWLQNEDPSRMLTFLPQMREVAKTLQTEMQPLRGPYAICHLCKPAVKLKMEEFYKHDTEVHHAYRSK